MSVLAAGSLATTFEEYVGPAFREERGIDLRGEYYGTNALLRMVEDGTHHPDVVVGADAALLRERLYDEFTGWDVTFATNSLGLGYDDRTPLGTELDAGNAWYEAVRTVGERGLAISDPDIDPLGYRAIQAFSLAEREHGLAGFRERVVSKAYREPEEPQLLAGVETGARAGAVVYRNMAVDHDVAFREFPAAYNFADPTLADHYATVTYTTDEGRTIPGRPIRYNATVLDGADAPDAGRELVAFLANNPSVLEEAGLSVGKGVPRPHGNVPEGIDP